MNIDLIAKGKAAEWEIGLNTVDGQCFMRIAAHDFHAFFVLANDQARAKEIIGKMIEYLADPNRTETFQILGDVVTIRRDQNAGCGHKDRMFFKIENSLYGLVQCTFTGTDVLHIVNALEQVKKELDA